MNTLIQLNQSDKNSDNNNVDVKIQHDIITNDSKEKKYKYSFDELKAILRLIFLELTKQKLEIEFQNRCTLILYLIKMFNDEGRGIMHACLESSSNYNKQLYDDTYDEYTLHKKVKEGFLKDANLYGISKMLDSYGIDVRLFGIDYTKPIETFYVPLVKLKPNEKVKTENKKETHQAKTSESSGEDENAIQEALKNELLTSPTLPDEIFESLPQLFKEGCSAFTDTRERDVFLTGAIIILSGCFPSISGVYDARSVYANLYCYIIAPPASGKSALVSAKALGNSFHNKLKKKSYEAEKQYKIDLQAYKNKLKSEKDSSKKDNSLEPPPEVPKFKTLYIPANSSSASMNDSIYNNDENGIICETEGATVESTLKQDWGGYLDLLLKCFHHENISVKRKGDKVYIDMDCPKLAVGITNTIQQVLGLIPSAEDGLFSRFIHYAFHVVQSWRDVSPYSGRKPLDEQFKPLSKQVTKMIEQVNNRAIKFELTESQWNELNRLFARRLNEITALVGDEAGSSVKRLGLIAFRIAMVLSIIRNCNDSFKDDKIICQDMDFEIAMKLSDVYMTHAMIVYKRLPKGNHHKINSKIRKLFYEKLPNEFKREEAVAVGISLNIPDRTVDHYLKIFIGKILEKSVKYGYYKKI